MTFRCSVAGFERGDDHAGTASTVRAFLLVENPGPWGVDALRDARLPAAVKDGVRRAAARARVRPLLIRRYHRSAPRSGFRVFAARVDPDHCWLETTVLDRTEDLLDLDLGALGAGRSPGLSPADGPLFLVCTHGRHDACCAERGRPVAAALSAAHPEETWEVSHIGGDRFAGNALVLPRGLYLGRLDERTAVAAADDVLAGRLPLDALRGRSCFPMPVQAAEIGLRRRLGAVGLDDVRVLAHRRSGELTTADLAHRDLAHREQAWRVVIRTVLGDASRLSCRAERDDPVPTHEVVAVERS